MDREDAATVVEFEQGFAATREVRHADLHERVLGSAAGACGLAGSSTRARSPSEGSRPEATARRRSAEGGIVSNAEETATFLTALMQGRLLGRQQLAAMAEESLWRGGVPSDCGPAFGWSGGGSGFETEAWVDRSGRRVAVLLLNARHFDTARPEADRAAHEALTRLFCGA